MIDVKQNRDLIIVYCDHCRDSKLHFYASSLNEPLDDAIRACGWQSHGASGSMSNLGEWVTKDNMCRACIRKAQGKGRRD